jgi:DNA-binding HxlR family transcriptional regulator
MKPNRRGDLLAAQCPSRQVLQHVTSRWGVLVLVVLRSDGVLRFGELRRRIGGVSEKMLAQTLQDLASDGFVERREQAVLPLHVDYRLTRLGAQVAAHVHELADWIEASWPAIERARASLQAV